MDKAGQRAQMTLKTHLKLQCLIFGPNCELGSQYLSLKFW